MATKEHSTKFLDLRRSAAKDRPLGSSGNHSNDSDSPLMLEVLDEPGTEMNQLGNKPKRRKGENVEVPAWLKRIKPIEQALDNVLIEMDDLKKLHSKKLHNLSFSNTADEDAIGNQSKKITRLIRDAKDEIKKLGMGQQLSPQVTYMRDNIQKVLASRLQDIGNTFRSNQLQYQSDLNAVDKPKKSPSVAGLSAGPGLGNIRPSAGPDSAVPLDDDSDDDNDVSSYDIGLSGDQQARVETNRIRINQRMNEIREIAQQVEELGQMFTDIANMVHEQGSLLDRIDYNIESADHSVVEAKKNLTEVVAGEKGFSKRLCLLLLLIIVIGVVVIILIMTK